MRRPAVLQAALAGESKGFLAGGRRGGPRSSANAFRRAGQRNAWHGLRWERLALFSRPQARASTRLSPRNAELFGRHASCGDPRRHVRARTDIATDDVHGPLLEGRAALAVITLSRNTVHWPGLVPAHPRLLFPLNKKDVDARVPSSVKEAAGPASALGRRKLFFAKAATRTQA